jgi:hypothetical protein
VGGGRGSILAILSSLAETLPLPEKLLLRRVGVGGGGLQREPGKNQDRKPFKGLFNLVGSLCFHGAGSVPNKTG